MKRVLAACTAILIWVGITVVALPGGAVAAPAKYLGSCKDWQAGNSKVHLFKKHFTWDVRQQDEEDNYTGRDAKIEFVVAAGHKAVNTVSSSMKVSTALQGKVWKIFSAQVKAEAGLQVGWRGESWSFERTTRTYTLPTGHTYEWGRGRGRWSAPWGNYRCTKINMDGLYEWVRTSYGRVQGFPSGAHAMVRCDARPPAGSFAATLKRSYCP